MIYVSPISKRGDISQVINYRPISITLIIPKIFEKIVSKLVNPLFINIIINEQHGFISGRSTTMNFLIFQHYILDPIKSSHQVDGTTIEMIL